jgi:hypothetical protein
MYYNTRYVVTRECITIFLQHRLVCLAACAIAYTHNAPATHAGGVLNITADQSLLKAIITGYETDDFAKKLTKDIHMGSIEGATLTDNLLYVGRHLVIPQDLKVRKLLYNLAHDTLGHFGFDKSYESLRGSKDISVLENPDVRPP